MKKFKDLSLKGQRKRIIQDALAQITLKKFIPRNGYYVRFPSGSDGSVTYFPNGNESVQNTLIERKCECCAKGALFASCVLSVNKVYGSTPLNDEVFQKNKLSKWFKSLELDSIETAFELRLINSNANIGVYNYNDSLVEYTEFGRKCLEFGRKYKTPRTRLVGILNNVLKNGTFKP